MHIACGRIRSFCFTVLQRKINGCFFIIILYSLWNRSSNSQGSQTSKQKYALSGRPICLCRCHGGRHTYTHAQNKTKQKTTISHVLYLKLQLTWYFIKTTTTKNMFCTKHQWFIFITHPFITLSFEMINWRTMEFKTKHKNIMVKTFLFRFISRVICEIPPLSV